MALSVPRFLSTKTYTAQDDRHAQAASGMQAGVMAIGASTEFKVVQRGAGANMSVDISAGDSGAWVNGLDTTRQGSYHVYNDATVNVAVSAANATNPRIDQVVLRVYDTSVIGGGTDAAQLEVIAGTATSGATLDNRTGAANLATIAAPKTLIRLADILVPAASSSVTTANIRDRRPWARGALFTVTRLINAGGTNSYTTTSTTSVNIDTTNLAPRIECSGVTVRVTLAGSALGNTAGMSTTFDLGIDGTAQSLAFQVGYPTVSSFLPLFFQAVVTPTAGSHVISPMWKVSAGTATLAAQPGFPLLWTIEELSRQNTSNGT